MADIVKIQVSASGAKETLGTLQELEASVKRLNAVKLNLNVDKETARLISAQAKLAAANAKILKSNNDLAIAREKTKRAADDRAISENKLAQQMEKTATAEENARIANTKLSLQIEKTNTVRAQEELQTAKIVTEYARAETQTAKTATREQELAIQSEKTRQAELKQQAATEKLAASMHDLGSRIARILWRKFIEGVRQSLETIKELDSEMATYRKITGASKDETKALEEQLYKTATAYGVLVTDIAQTTTAFAQAGYRDQSAALGELATKAQIVGDMTADEASSFLIAVDAAYKMNGSVSELSRVLDGINEIENTTATRMGDVAQGIGLVASVAEGAGVNVDQLASAIGTLNAVTQRSGSENARAFRAIILNILGDTQTVLDEDSGEKLAYEDVQKAKIAMSAYATEAYKAAAATGQNVDVMAALGEVAEKYKEGVISDTELTQLAMEVGGKLRSNQFQVIIKNFDLYEQNLESIAGSAGSADKEVSTMLDTWEAKSNILKNTWDEFVAKTINSDMAKSLLALATNALEFAGSLDKVAIAIASITIAIKSANTVIKGWAGLISLLTIVVMDWQHKLDKIQEEARETRDKAIETASAAADEAEKIAELVAEYESAVETGKGLKAASENLAKALGVEGDAVDDLAEKYKSLSKEKLEQAVADANASKIAAAKALETNVGDYVNIGQDTIISWDGSKTAWNAVSDLFENDERTLTGASFAPANAEELLQFYDHLVEAKKRLNKAAMEEGKENLVTSSTYTAIVKQIQKLKPDVDAYRSAIEQVTYAQGLLDGVIEKANIAINSEGKAIDRVTGATRRAKGPTAELSATVLELTESFKSLTRAEAEQIALSTAFNIAQEAVNARLTGDMTTLDALALRTRATSDATWDLVAAKLAEADAIKGKDLTEGEAVSKAQALINQLRNGVKNAGSGTSGSGGGSGSTTDTNLTAKQALVSLRKAELSFMQASGASTDAMIAKRREIQEALHDEAEYMRSIGKSEEEILALSTEWWSIQNDINELLLSAAEYEIDKQIEALTEVNEVEEKRLAMEEKRAAMLEAQNALLDAQNERTVRIFNAEKNRWEWVANAKNVQAAQDKLNSARDSYVDSYNEWQRARQTEALEAQRTAVTEAIMGTSGTDYATLPSNISSLLTGANRADSSTYSTYGMMGAHTANDSHDTVYQFGSVVLTERQANAMTVAQLAAQLRGLAITSSP